MLLSHNAKVYLAARSPSKANAAIAELKAETGKEAIFLQLDLSDILAVRRSAEEFLSYAQFHPAQMNPNANKPNRCPERKISYTPLSTTRKCRQIVWVTRLMKNGKWRDGTTDRGYHRAKVRHAIRHQRSRYVDCLLASFSFNRLAIRRPLVIHDSPIACAVCCHRCVTHP